MTPQMIQIILWIPFIFVAAITIPVFCSAGFRRGAWNALVSLAATVIAAVCSVALARLLAGPVSKPITRALSEVIGDSTVPMGMVLINGVVCVFMAMGLYFLLMLVLTALFKYIARALWGEELERTDTNMRWGGLGVRLVDGVLYTLLLLLPLYGSLGNVLPVLSSISGIFGEDGQTQQTVLAVTQHPVAKASSAGPLKAVYGQLAVVPTESGDIAVVEVVQSVSGTVERYQMLEEAAESGEMTVELAEEMVDFLRDEVLHQPWVYSAYREVLNSVPQEAYEDPMSAQLLELIDMDEKTFAKNMDTILSVVQYAFEEDVIVRIQQEPDRAMEILYDSGMMERLGEMINSSPEAIGLRDFIIRESVVSLCDGDNRKATVLMASYDSRLHLDEASRLRDAEAMLLLVDAVPGNGRLHTYEALLRLGFDQDELYDIYRNREGDMLEFYFWEGEENYQDMQDELQDKYGKELSMEEMIWQELLEASQMPLGQYDLAL